MTNTGRATIAGIGATIIIGGGLVIQKLNTWFPGEPTGPGSGEEIPYSPEPTGPGSGEEIPYSEPEPTGPGSGEVEPSGPGSGEEISQSDVLKAKAKGSCNAIEKGSTCIEYIGSFWSSNTNTELNCKGAGIYSKNPCPRPTTGGCQISGGTMNEIVMWNYTYGGDPFTPEIVNNVAKVCNANPFGSWVAP